MNRVLKCGVVESEVGEDVFDGRTPPLLAVTDPCAVAARADGVLLTLRIRKGVQDVAARAMELLRSVDANVLGTVINGVEESSGFDGVSGKYGTTSDDTYNILLSFINCNVFILE